MIPPKQSITNSTSVSGDIAAPLRDVQTGFRHTPPNLQSCAPISRYDDKLLPVDGIDPSLPASHFLSICNLQNCCISPLSKGPDILFDNSLWPQVHRCKVLSSIENTHGQGFIAANYRRPVEYALSSNWRNLIDLAFTAIICENIIQFTKRPSSYASRTLSPSCRQ